MTLDERLEEIQSLTSRYIKSIAMDFVVVIVALAYIFYQMITLEPTNLNPLVLIAEAIMGIICGVVHGFIRIWLIGVFIMAFAWTGVGQWASVQINDNPILSLIYNHNLIVSALTNMSKLLF